MRGKKTWPMNEIRVNKKRYYAVGVICKIRPSVEMRGYAHERRYRSDFENIFNWKSLYNCFTRFVKSGHETNIICCS